MGFNSGFKGLNAEQVLEKVNKNYCTGKILIVMKRLYIYIYIYNLPNKYFIIYYWLNFDQNYPNNLRTLLPVNCVQFAMETTAMYQHCRRKMVFLITATVLFSVRYELIVL